LDDGITKHCKTPTVIALTKKSGCKCCLTKITKKATGHPRKITWERIKQALEKYSDCSEALPLRYQKLAIVLTLKSHVPDQILAGCTTVDYSMH
jgi:hypothetical protein